MKQRTVNLFRLKTHQLSWLFLLGVNNSGTTLLEALLGRHNEIAMLPGEGQRLSRAIVSPNQKGVRRLWTEKLEAFRRSAESSDGLLASRLKWDWLGFYSTHDRSRFLMEKSPPNTVRAPWLQHHFRRAFFVAITRSPYAVAEGIRRREGYDIERAARHWALANEILLADLERLDRRLLLTYEDLCADPSREMSLITSFLGTKQYPENFLLDELSIHNASGRKGLIKNFNDSSYERLSAEDVRKIEDIAGDLMARLGYDFLTG